MAELRADVLVLGAGMVGVSAALHLQQRGRDVILADRHALAGEETSFGNAGLIESASVFPYMFPRDLAHILQYALNRAPQVRYHLSDLPGFLPWLIRYYLASSKERALHSAMAELPLIRRGLIEHEALIAEAQVPQLLRHLRLRDQRLMLDQTAPDQRQFRHRRVQRSFLRGCEIIAYQPWQKARQVGKMVAHLWRAIERVLQDMRQIPRKHVREDRGGFDQSGVAETGFFAGERMPVGQDHVASPLLQVQRGADADHARAQYEN